MKYVSDLKKVTLPPFQKSDHKRHNFAHNIKI